MATIRNFLDGKGFDWGTGLIILQWTRRPWDVDVADSRRVEGRNDAALDYEFNEIWDGREGCPRFIAHDSEAVYFPCVVDGVTWCEKVFKDPERYSIGEVLVPYPGY